MPSLSISQLASFTGKDRRTIAKAVEPLDFREGPDNAHLYDSEIALAAIYMPPSAGGDGRAVTLDQAKREQALEAALLSKARREEIQRTRIPLEIVARIWDTALQTFAATLKAARGKTLDVAKINELLEQLRAAKLPLSW